MRRANQADASTDGQLRVVGDHLGSTSLVFNTAAPSTVIHRAYYKPYGEVAWQTGSSRTSVGFTGQRLDSESGLMEFGARYYDPVLSHFISADPTVPDLMNPLDHHRYLYVRGNPLRYIDLLGYGPNDHYIFVNGCTPSFMCSSAPQPTWDEYQDYLYGEYKKWQRELARYGEPPLPPWEQWKAEHVHFITALTLGGAAEEIESTIAGIKDEGANIHLIGHSFGGTAIMRYFANMKRNERTGRGRQLDPRVKSVALIDAPLDLGTLSELDVSAWMARKGIAAINADTPLDGIGNNCAAPGMDNVCNPNYIADPKGGVRSDLPPFPFAPPWLPGAGTYNSAAQLQWHSYTFDHMAVETRAFLQKWWK